MLSSLSVVFQAGTTNNVIADTAFLHGTIRALTHSMSLLVQKRVKAIAEGVAAAFDMDVEIELKQGGYLPVENNPELAGNWWPSLMKKRELN